MKKISLTQGQFALVDNEDFDYLNQWKWCTVVKNDSPNSPNRYYACRRQRIGLRCENKGIYIRMHRLIMNATNNVYVDHKNHNGLDNQKHNLRLVTPVQNQWNSRKCLRKTKSKYKGVRIRKHKGNVYYQFAITVNGKRINGSSKSEIEAAIAYDRFALKYFGEFAYTNFQYVDRHGLKFKLNTIN